ncbi:MAG TPA: GNAT family N-acetyltransferase [Fimbriimonas sp.]
MIDISLLGPQEPVGEFADVMASAFQDYPVMVNAFRHAPGPRIEWVRGLAALSASHRQDVSNPILIARDGERTVGAAMLTLPGYEPSPDLETAFCDYLDPAGPTSLPFFEAFFNAVSSVEVPRPHAFLKMLGVDRAYQGRGVGRKLLERTIEIAAGTEGIVLDTEHERNLGLYRRFGFEVAGETAVGDMPVWVMWRPQNGG